MKLFTRKNVVMLMVAASLLFAGSAHAGLVEPILGTAYINGSVYYNVQAIYDDELDITYLDIPAASDYFNNAGDYVFSILWISDGYDDSYSDWRLPETGTVDQSYNELEHLYYVELGNISYADFLNCQYDCGEDTQCLDSCQDSGLVNVGPFDNLVESIYWFGDDESTSADNTAPYFDFRTGSQSESGKARAPFYILPVRDGAISTADDGGDMTVECGTLTDQTACEAEVGICHWNGLKCKNYPNQ